MKYRLSDIIDLDYLVRKDDDAQITDGTNARLLRDRKIYGQIKENFKGGKAVTGKDLLFAWLDIRKQQYIESSNGEACGVLPGNIFSVLYRWMAVGMVCSGLFTGFSLAGSFLVYHGSLPINVTVFLALFVALPFCLSLAALVFIGFHTRQKQSQGSESAASIFHTLISFFLFDLLPKLMKKIHRLRPEWETAHLEHNAWLFRMKTREYRHLFFWPFFVLTCTFAVSFSTGALGATFFKVLVSDMAFGWQSTLITSGEAVHKLVSLIALPWDVFLPDHPACPSLEQIEGSRIILKQGISVLATENLVSWWPFVCISMLFYTVLPRSVFIIAGLQIQKRVLAQFEFYRPEFKQLIIRMTSPVLDVGPSEKQKEPLGKAPSVADEKPEDKKPEKLKPKVEKPKTIEKIKEPDVATVSMQLHYSAMIFASDQVYPQAVLARIKEGIEQRQGVVAGQTLGLRLNAADISDRISPVDFTGIDPVILLYEAWQPPIRGLLYSISGIRKKLPRSTALWVMLTSDAGRDDLSVEDLVLKDHDEQFEIWQSAVRTLGDPMIIVKRFI